MHFLFNFTFYGLIWEVFEVILLESLDKGRVNLIDHFLRFKTILVHVGRVWPAHDKIEGDWLVGEGLAEFLEKNIGLESEYEARIEKICTRWQGRSACNVGCKTSESYLKSGITVLSLSGFRISNLSPFTALNSMTLSFWERMHNVFLLPNSGY